MISASRQNISNWSYRFRNLSSFMADTTLVEPKKAPFDGVSLLFGVGLAGSGAMTTLINHLMPNQLWALVEPLLPAPPRPTYGGRHRVITRSQLLRRDRVQGPDLDPVAAAARP